MVIHLSELYLTDQDLHFRTLAHFRLSFEKTCCYLTPNSSRSQGAWILQVFLCQITYLGLQSGIRFDSFLINYLEYLKGNWGFGISKVCFFFHLTIARYFKFYSPEGIPVQSSTICQSDLQFPHTTKSQVNVHSKSSSTWLRLERGGVTQISNDITPSENCVPHIDN